ncbi:MAG: formate dehydrogenase subunit delta [Pseudomonadota bacterium]|jgi:formate dehydrogenase subunit delta
MNIQHLVRMANDIANFFMGELGDAEAPNGIAQHLQRYWDPRMRAAIIEHVKQGGADLRPAVVAAVRSLQPPPPR